MAKTKGSLNERLERVDNAVRAKFEDQGPEPKAYVYARAVYDTSVVFRKADKFFQVSYTIDAKGQVVIGDDAKEVLYVETFEPVKESVGMGGQFFGPLDEAGHALEAGAEPTGKQWGVVIIQEGMSKNRNRYQRKVLEAAAPLYEGARVYKDHQDPESRPRFGRSVEACIGFIKDVQGVVLGATQEGAGTAATGSYALTGTLVVTKEAWQKELLDAWHAGNPNLYGLSHDVLGKAVVVMESNTGRAFYDMQEIQKVDSVDLVTNPAAGGRVMRAVASDVPANTLQGDERMLKKLIEAIRGSGHADLVRKLEALGAEPTEDGVMGIHAELITRARAQEAVAQPAAAVPAVVPAAVAPAAAVQVQEATTGMISVQEAVDLAADGRQSFVESTLAGCSLPDLVKDNLRQRFTGQITGAKTMAEMPAKTVILSAVREQVELFGKLTDAKVIVPGGGGMARVEIGNGPREKFQEAMGDFFDPKKPAQSFRNLYVEFTGDKQVTGLVREAQRLTEALQTSSFGEILGDSVTRRMLAEYKVSPLANWRGTVAEVVPVSDFRSQRRLRFGGYGNLSAVTEGGAYPSLTSPTDEEATYSASKRGGTEQLTMEMIVNDDVAAIRRIPGRLARAANQTLHEFVWDFLRTNAAIYDTVALAASGHSNIVTTALTSSNVSSLRLKMKQQTDMSNSKRQGFLGRYLIGPSDLEDLIYQLTGADKMLPGSSLDATAEPAAPNPIRRYNLTPIIVEYWTDASDYWMAASLDQLPMIEVGFLNGREEPELFVQDQPNQGSMFTNDKVTYKLRHIYGGGVMDYRGFAAGIVP